MVWGSFLNAIAAAALKTPTRNGYNAQGVNLIFLLFRRFICELFSYRKGWRLLLNPSLPCCLLEGTHRVGGGEGEDVALELDQYVCMYIYLSISICIYIHIYI